MFKALIGNAGLLAAVSLTFTGCSNLPGNKETQGAVIGGASGAAIGAAVGGEENRLLGALIGGALGAGGGYVIGANSDRITGRDREAAEEAVQRSQEAPATPEQAQQATTADINNDGFVTLDEVVAMEQAGLSDQEMLDRMEATNQVFELTEDQKQYLTSRGVSPSVVQRMETINAQTRQELLNNRREVISREPGVR